MKKTRRWLALLLAVTLVGSNALYQLGTSMSASETETTSESVQQDESATASETQSQDTASLNQQDTGGVKVQEVTPQTSSQNTQSQNNTSNNTSVTGKNTQVAQKTEQTQAAPEEKTYNVTIKKSDVEGGTIKAWGSDGNKTDVTYDNENKYVKEVKEGGTFNFEITAKDTYKVAKVTDQNGTTVQPKAVNNNVYTYEVKNITAERIYSITYEKEKTQKTASNGDQKKSDDEKSDDADDDGESEPAAKTQAQTVAEEVMTDFYVDADRTSVTVGDKVNVKAIIKPDTYSNKNVTWKSSDDKTATVDENGVVTTLKTGIVTITGTSEANQEYTDSVVIQINPVSVTSIKISGYNRDYLIKNDTVQLTATAEPQSAEDKDLTWSSSDETVATVDQNGKVTAKGQGTAVIRVENTASGKYATQEVTVYATTPQSVTVRVWVTNLDQNKTYTFYLPKDGTVVNASSVHKSVAGYVTTRDIRVGSWKSNDSWATIKSTATVKRFRYSGNQVQYSTSSSGSSWKNVSGNKIIDFCESLREGNSGSDTDVKVILGDWPYGNNDNTSHNKQTIRIEVVEKDDAGNTTVVYNSGTMRYDNNSNGQYGKIKFNCDESRYEVEQVLIYTNDAGTGSADTTYKPNELPADGIDVSFTKGGTNHYLVQAVVTPKKFNVVYDANGGKNAPKSEKLTAVNRQKVTVATTPQPTKTDYIFAGWEYNGTTYYGGESFEMPPSNVTFVAKWIPASTAISYKSNNADWGTVSRSHEIVKDGATAKGSVANAKEGYEFVEWQDADGKQVSTDNFYQPDEKAGSYTAIFKAKTYNVTYQFTGTVPEGAELPAAGKYEFDSKVTAAEVADVPGYTFEGWTSQDVTLKNGKFTMPAKNVTLTGTWKQKEGRFGYYLSLANAAWEGGTPDNLEVSGTSGQGLPKYAEKVHYSYGDKYNVISNVPTAEGHAFIGWLDKKRGNQSAAIRTAGDELTYIYKAGDENQAYTLDALWASIAAKGGTYLYNGSSRQITADIAINEGLNLNAEYVEQAKKFIKTGKMEYSTDNKNWSEENPGFTDAGTYTVYVRQNVTVGKTTTTLQSSAQIVINPRNVELTSATASKMYDGKALTKKEVTVSGDGFITGEGATYNVTGSQKVVGSSENTFTYTLTNATKAKNYNITTKNGTLTVTNRDAKYEITVEANRTTATYDGTEHSAVGLKTTTFTVDGEEYTVSGLKTEDPKQKNAGTYTNNITGTAVVKDEDGNDVTDQFSVKTSDGKLVINKAAVTLKSANLSKEYDGEALVNGNTVLETETGWAEGEGADYAFTGSQTLVGSSNNAFTYAPKAGTATNFDNYTISKTEGTLTVTNRSAKYEITVKANRTTTTYDGKKHSAKGVESNEFTINGKKYTVSGLTTEDPEKKNAGFYTNNISGTAVVKDAKGNDVTDQFSVKFENGSLVINKATVTLKSADLNKEYDGKALVNGKKALATETGWAEGEGADYTFTGSQTLVGSSNNAFTFAPKAGTATNFDNYTINKTEGTLTVTNRDAKYNITVEANRTTATYDGTEYRATGLKTTTFTVNGEEYTVSGLTTEDPAQTDAGTYTNNITGTAIVTDKDGNNVTSEFAVNTVNGNLIIDKANVTLKSADLDKVYDGKALVNGNTALATETGWAERDKAAVAYEFTGSQTEVGNSENKFAVKWNNTVKESNYNVSIEFGTLTVTEQSIIPGPDPENPDPNYKGITINDPSDVPYDGAEHKWTPTVTDKDGNELKEGTDYEVSYDKDDFTNVTGNIKVTITGKGNYTGTVDKKYQITPKTVTITTDSKEKVFNNEPLTAPGRVDGIVDGETYGFNVTGTQTYVGKSANSYQMTWAKKGENKYTAKKSNYKVEENIGTLTVTDGTPENPVDPSLVVNKTHDKKKTYKVGDVITFTITVKNIYDEAKTITLEEQESVTLDKTTFENVQPGKEITATATYTVTEADIIRGTFTNNVKATFSGVDKEYTGTDTVDKFEESNPHMTITKTTKNADEGHIYKLGETIQYVITVENDGNLTLTNVKIEDALTGNAGDNAWTIDTLAPGKTETFEASYTVTEADVLAGKVINNVTGEAENPDPDVPKTPVTPGEKEDPIETPNPNLTVVKTADKTGEVKLGEKITYTITVTNNGNVTISGVKLNDSLTGDEWTFDDIKPNASVTKKTTYTVTEKDIIAGKIRNLATAEGKDPTGKDVKGEGEKTVTTEESNPQITVTKKTTSKPANGETYALGEKITYEITAKNTGNLTLTNVTVSDELTGNTGDKAFKIEGEFKPNDEVTFKTSYTVKESDLGKTVVNVATATGTTPDPDKPTPGVKPGETEDPTDQKNPKLSITKKVIDKKDEYQIGDTVKYEITVENTGNTTQNNVLVEDQMNAAGSAVITKVEGAKGTIDGANVTLDTLAPGKSATISAEYTVVKADRGNTITNAAVAKGEGENPETPEVPVDVEDVYDIHVKHVFADGEESDTALPEDYDIENLKPGTTKLLNAEAVSGYTAYPATQRATIENEDVTVTFVYYKDTIGTDPTNPDQPDNIPDRYQVVVRFEAVNGTVNIDHAVVTLFDENNEPAENGVGHLSLLQIALATANAGYDQSSLSWTPGTPTIRYEITGAMTFTARFTATPATPVTPTNTPDGPNTPVNPTTPATPARTPARSTNIITRAANAIANGAERIASDVREVLNNDDGDVPLANQKLDDHKCCILHFLIMLLAAILYGFYTHNMKKRQKKMFEAREELDLELARRGLPTTKEQEEM